MALTYAIGDIHGSLNKLTALMTRCAEHAGSTAPIYVFLGDYIDRGPEARGVIDYLIALQSRFPTRVIALKGNHEAMALAAVDDAAAARLWLAQGGLETLASYGIAHPGALPEPHRNWLRSLRLSFDDGRRLFVHAGIDPLRPLDAQLEQDLLWMREPFLSYAGDHGRLIVHGHTPLARGVPDLRSNRLNLDTAAVYGGPLTAAVFNDEQTCPLGFLQAR